MVMDYITLFYCYANIVTVCTYKIYKCTHMHIYACNIHTHHTPTHMHTHTCTHTQTHTHTRAHTHTHTHTHYKSYKKQ